MKKKRVILSIFFIFALLFIQIILSQKDFQNKYSNKFDSSLIGYLQNNSRVQNIQKINNFFRASSSQEPKIPIIISFYDKIGLNKTYKDLLKSGSNIEFSYQLINAIAAKVNPSEIQELSLNKEIKGVYLDKKIQLETQNYTFEKSFYEGYKKEINSFKYKLAKYENISIPFLNESTNYIGTPLVWAQGIDGTGTKIAILDTGIDDTHPDFAGKVIAKRDFTLFDDELKTEDGYGHGTHCAGIAAGTGKASIKSINTSLDISGLLNLPYYPNDYRLGNEYLQLKEDSEPANYKILIVKNIPAKGESILNETLHGASFDFETNNAGYYWRTADFSFYNNELFSGYYWNSLSDLGNVNLDSAICPEHNSLNYSHSFEVYANHTYCIFTSDGNYVNIKVTQTESNYLKFDYKWQNSTPPMVFFDLDGNFNSIEDQFIASNNNHIQKIQKNCTPMGECFYYSPLMIYNLSSTLDSLNIIPDFNEDNIPDYMRGVAPGADLLNGKVLSNDGYGYYSGIIAGIEWALLNKADVISMSLGGWENICDGEDPLSEAVEKASDMNVTVVVAAGNSGEWGKETLGSPGCADKIITVGASAKTYYYNSKIADFSSQGPSSDGRIKPEILAPGIGIIAPQANNTSMGYSPLMGYISLSGTSMATPHIAGAVALLKQANPSLKPQQIKEILMNTARDIPGESVFRQGAGIVDVLSAYYNSLGAKAPLSELNIVQSNKETKEIDLSNIDNAISNVTAYKDELKNTSAYNFHGIVSPTNGFYYNFSITSDTLAFVVNISWFNKLNDVDMKLMSPSGDYYSSALGDSNNEIIAIDNPKEGNWSLYVYPWWVGENINVFGSLSLKNLAYWNWFYYNSTNKKLIVKSDINESGLYAGKLFLKARDNLTITMIPTSIILSEKIDFQNKIVHSAKISPCENDSFRSQDWESSINSQESYANIDGYFCNELQRRAFSFSIAKNLPYFSVYANWWNPTSYNYGDIRMFLYAPNGSLFSSTDDSGNYESIYAVNPEAGNWTVVFQAEFLPKDGIVFSGEVVMPNLIFNPESLFLEVKKGDKKSAEINITNFLDYELDISIENIIWNETAISIMPESNTDETIAPFSNAYLYYTFNIPPEYLGDDNYLKSVYVTKEGVAVYGLEAYIFDADKKLVNLESIYYPESKFSMHHDISKSAKPGNWTLVISIEGFSYEKVPLNVSLFLLRKDSWNWADTKEPHGFFKGTDKLQINVSVPKDISNEDKIAALSLTGGWWGGESGNREFYMPFSMVYPVFISIFNPNCSADQDCGNNSFVGDKQCNDNSVYQNFLTFECINPNTSKSYCNQTNTFMMKSDCGSSYCEDYSKNYCKANNIYKNRTCFNKGCSEGDCYTNPFIEETLVESCNFGCVNGKCSTVKILNPLYGNNYNSRKIPFTIISLNELQALKYTDNSDRNLKEKKLCTNCKVYNKMLTFNEGFHSLNITSLDSQGDSSIFSLNFFIDFTLPKITKTLPKKNSAASGVFNLEFIEQNPVNVTLSYGNINNRKTAVLDINNCLKNKDKYSCSIYVDLSDYKNQDIFYSFKIIDIAGNFAESKNIIVKG